ncbi:MAG: glycosyltransferase [Terracidiphilus sp.]|nr:glycosyltransferase [Terracidiphilus sp.]
MNHTVAIPTYRRPDVLRKSLEGLVRQERPIDEVIVVVRKDDHASREVAEEYLTKLPLQVGQVEVPGVVVPVNCALDMATGDIVSLIDDDAVAHPDWARKIIEVFEDDPGLAGLGGRDHIFENGRWKDGNRELTVGIVRWYGATIGNHHLGIGPRRDVDCLKGVNMSFRRSDLGALRADTRLRGSGAQWCWELGMCLNLRAQGKRLAYDPSIVVDHLVAARYDEDQRGSFNELAFENQNHNMTMVLLGYLNWPGRILLMHYALLIGIKGGYCGLLKGLLLWPMRGNIALRRMRAGMRGVLAGWKSWRAGRTG